MTGGCHAALDLPRPAAPSLPLLMVVAAALINDQGDVLIAQRPPGKRLAGLWEFPGGKLEHHEPPEFALMRELSEELNIETRPTCYYPIGFSSYAYDDFHLLMPLYMCRVWRGTPTAMEGQVLKWIPPRQLYNYPMPPADIPLIAQIIDRV